MDREMVIAALRALLPALRQRFGVRSVAVFGSAARGQAGAASDVDLFVSFEPGFAYSLADLAAIADLAEEVVGRPVDVVTDHPGLSDDFRRIVEEDMIRVA